MSRQTRAVLIPFCSDPFLFNYWLKFYKNIWRDEVDRVYILFNGSVPAEELSASKLYCASLIVDALELPVDYEKISFNVVTPNIDHGPALKYLLNLCNEDLVMLMEEDTIVFKPGEINRCFEMIESGEVDAVGSPRGSCSEEIAKAADRLWGTRQEPAFWPNFFFCKRKDLLATDLHFQAKSWQRGERIEPINLTVEDEIAVGDTFVWASLQLRAMGLRFKEVDQYHGYPWDLEDYVHQRNIFDRKCPWFHIGSLSGWYNTLMEENLRPQGETSASEYERRVQFWLTYWEHFDPKTLESLPVRGKLEEMHKRYKQGIDRMIEGYDLSPARIKERQRIYQNMFDSEDIKFLELPK